MSELVATQIKKQSKFWTFLAKAFLLVALVVFSGTLAAFGAQVVISSQDSLSAKITKEEFGPREKVAIVFSKKVDPSQIEEGFSISPNEKLKLFWTENNQELDLKPASNFQPGEKYNVKIKTKEGIFKNRENEINLSFQIEDYPKVLKAEPGKENISVSINSEFKVFFDKPTSDYDINFVVDPFDGFSFETNDKKTEFRIFPKDKLQYETEYKLKITANVAGGESSGPPEEIFSGTFKTEKKPYVPPVWSSSAVIPDDQVIDSAARIGDGKYIDINLSKQHLSIFEEGERLGTYRISSGKRGMATPAGNFRILSKRARAWSNKYKLFMPFWMQFTGAGHGIHELPEWPGGHKEGAAHLGIPVSHGCVRLGIGPAASVYGWADIGTPVVVHY